MEVEIGLLVLGCGVAYFRLLEPVVTSQIEALCAITSIEESDTDFSFERDFRLVLRIQVIKYTKCCRAFQVVQ